MEIFTLQPTPTGTSYPYIGSSRFKTSNGDDGVSVLGSSLDAHHISRSFGIVGVEFAVVLCTVSEEGNVEFVIENTLSW